MPCYGMGKYIAEALESVGKQRYTRWEVIAVDDCGPEDGTKEIIESFASEHPEHRVEYIRHEENGGVSKARNTAIKAASGEFIAPLDPDDYWLENHLEILQSKLSSAPQDTALAFSNVAMSPESPTPEVHPTCPDEYELRHLGRGLAFRNFIQPSATLLRRATLIEVGGFDETPEIQHVEDLDLWLSLLNEGCDFVHIDETTAVYRHHGGSASLDGAGPARARAIHIKHSRFLLEHVYSHARMLQYALDQRTGQLAAVTGSRWYRIGQTLLGPLRKLLNK